MAIHWFLGYQMNTHSHVLESIQGIIGKYCKIHNSNLAITLINKLQCSYVCIQIKPEQLITEIETFIIPALKSTQHCFVLIVEATLKGISIHYKVDDKEQINTLDINGHISIKEPIKLLLSDDQNIDVLTGSEALFKSCLRISSEINGRYGLQFKLFDSVARGSVQLEDLRYLNEDALLEKLHGSSLETHIKLCSIEQLSNFNKEDRLSKKVIAWPFFDTDLMTVLSTVRFQTRLSILVADDSLPSQIATKVMLEMLGCSVTCAENGESALILAQNESFDLLLLDERMPGMYGSDVAQQLTKQNSPNNTTPKVILTGLTCDEQIAELFDKGITHYLQKPVTKAVLEKFIKPWQAA